MQNWLNVSDLHDFSIHNLPFGVVNRDGLSSPCIAIGDHIIDLRRASEIGILDSLPFDHTVFQNPLLNPFIETGKSNWRALRNFVQEALCDTKSALHQHKDVCLVNRLTATMELPIHIGDYTDFYSSIEHATNVGKMFRDPANALLPNWKHIPVGYHGRASSIVVSGTDIKRPNGQTLPPEATQPIFGPSKRVDFELEMAFVVGKPTTLGDTIPVADAEDHIFGMTVFNDWSARDMQKWEYVPLGPFLAKNFASTVSPWIVTMEALEPFRCASVKQEPAVLPYLQYDGDKNFDINLEVDLTPESSAATTISKSNFKYMYWNMAQQLAHHTVNGCNVNVGDMMASGTISGKDENSYGSMLELCWGGKKDIPLNNGDTRKFILDGDTITMRAFCDDGKRRVGFGESVGKIIG
ncbi:MAG: fumarylacetoacetase [Bacteroidetes bacterium]|jgi:fumarylacetoacetase|nr:fumarylacetoacetase [Bacteroidota bacterium]